MANQALIREPETTRERWFVRDKRPLGRIGSASPEMPHLFLVPGMGGYDPNLGEIAAACKLQLHVTRISYPHWTDLLRNPSFDFDKLVSDAVAQIVAQASIPPILLAGYSFGGIVAAAVAARLQDIGHAVCFLGLIDIEVKPGNDDGTGATRPPMTRLQELAGFLVALRQGEGAGRLAYVVSRRLISPRWKPLLRFYARIPRQGLRGKFVAYLDRDLLFWHLRPLLKQWAAVRETLPPLQAAAFLFRTAQHDEHAPHHLGWDRLCPNLTVLSIPGTHLSVMGCALPALCAAFQQAASQILGDVDLTAADGFGFYKARDNR